MDKLALREKIRALLAELEAGDTNDSDLQDRLQALDRELHSALAHPDDDAAPESNGLDDRLRELSVEFAGRHPRLEPILTEITNMLANIGI